MELKIININSLLLPAWGVKRKKQIELFRIRSSVQRHGQIEPIKVRPTGEVDMLKDPLYEIIDGRTVYAALLERNVQDIYCLDYGNISEQAAKELYLQTEFTSKTPDPLRLAELVKELSTHESFNALCNKLPFDKDQIQYYIDLCDFDWKQHLSKTHKAQVGLF